ncbi:hypothetical protein GUJ93_ZPchr0006g41061 [Zizania palustris]|uniref:Uncharacterized protein n=1 Tax=Zizania palustris TaxID=103762 RepID=A0A8J5TGR0_ZIZPA|nr:hypothetical protein GUJ93_ZPchr0006g41061 [Zizania palustris]
MSPSAHACPALACASFSSGVHSSSSKLPTPAFTPSSGQISLVAADLNDAQHEIPPTTNTMLPTMRVRRLPLCSGSTPLRPLPPPHRQGCNLVLRRRRLPFLARWRRSSFVMLKAASDSSSGGLVGRTRSLLQSLMEDLEELKGYLDLGFGFAYHEIPEMCSTLQRWSYATP